MARVGRALAAVLAAAALAVVTWEIRDETISEHTDQPPDSTVTVIVHARERGAEQSLPELTEARFLSCRLEVQTDPAGPLEHLGDDRFRMVMRPALDESDRKQFRGCMEDWGIDHLQLDVVSMTPDPIED